MIRYENTVAGKSGIIRRTEAFKQVGIPAEGPWRAKKTADKSSEILKWRCGGYGGLDRGKCSSQL